MLLLAGLGNPGTAYAGNRHNVGFMAVEAIAARNGFAPWRKRFQGECAEGTLGGVRCLALKPMTYMNESGRAVAEAMRFYKLEAGDVIVFHDELDLEPGKLRVKLGGGAAGHNGLRSLTRHLGPGFRRVRIGIGHPGRKDQVHAHVLKDFAKADRAWLEPLLDAMADSAATLVAGDDGGFMNKVAVAMGRHKDKGADATGKAAVAGLPAGRRSERKKADAIDKPAAPRRSTPSQRELARLGARPPERRQAGVGATKSEPTKSGQTKSGRAKSGQEPAAAVPPAPALGEKSAPKDKPAPKDKSGGPFAALKRLFAGPSGKDRS